MDINNRYNRRSFTLKRDNFEGNEKSSNQRFIRYKTKLHFDSNLKLPAMVPLYRPAPKPSKLLLDYLNSSTPTKKNPIFKQVLNSARARALPSLKKLKVHHRPNALSVPDFYFR